MSATLVAAIPLVLLGTVALLCFVGCVIPEYHTVPPFTKYSDDTVLANKNCLAYWPLWETSDSVPAEERVAKRDGTYIDPTTAPAIYPWPSSTMANPPGPDILSDAAPGTLVQGVPGIVAGDLVQPANLVLATCMAVNGAYVKVDTENKAAINPVSFTVEAWVRVEWKSSDPVAWRSVLDSRDIVPGTGFGLHARPDDKASGVYHWEAVVGNGGSATDEFTSLTSPDPIPLGDSEGGTTPVYLALTYDAATQELILFVDGKEIVKTTTAYMPNTSKPLLIGAAAPFLPERPQPPDVVAGPLFPWVGAIQDVAIYGAALDGDTIAQHYDNGNGHATAG